MAPASPLLVAYYSRSGTTAAIGHALAQRLDADELPIEDLRNDGAVSVWRATLDRLLGTLPPIAEPALPLESYDLVVLGTPVWGGRASAPVRSFLRDYGSRLPEVAFFCTMGGSGADSAFADMQQRLGKVPRATCALDARILSDSSYQGALDGFAAQLTDTSHPPLHHELPPDGARLTS